MGFPYHLFENGDHWGMVNMAASFTNIFLPFKWRCYTINSTRFYNVYTIFIRYITNYIDGTIFLYGIF